MAVVFACMPGGSSLGLVGVGSLRLNRLSPDSTAAGCGHTESAHDEAGRDERAQPKQKASRNRGSQAMDCVQDLSPRMVTNSTNQRANKPTGQ